MSRIVTGGTWDPADWPLYFLAGDAIRSVDDALVARSRLLAANELACASARSLAGMVLQRGIRLLIDSGIFDLATRTARDMGLSFAAAASLPDAEVPGFADLKALYVSVLEEFGDRCWGYVELDQGSPTDREARRSDMRIMGLSPIPVYRPLTDPPDEFPDLLARYDRIAVGGIVALPARAKKRLLVSLAQIARDFPDTWIHLLGYIPLPAVAHTPFRSCDASWWKHLARYAALQPRAALAPISRMTPGALPVRGRGPDDTGSYAMADLAAGLSEASTERNWSIIAHTALHP